jgi:hypothetical protein
VVASSSVGITIGKGSEAIYNGWQQRQQSTKRWSGMEAWSGAMVNGNGNGNGNGERLMVNNSKTDRGIGSPVSNYWNLIL